MSFGTLKQVIRSVAQEEDRLNNVRCAGTGAEQFGRVCQGGV